MLSIRDLGVNFGHAEILRGVSLDVGAEPFAIAGRNGMGKTTLCYAIMGLVPVRAGTVTFHGARIDGQSTTRIARSGIAIVPQGRRVFPSLSVDEHLRLVSQGRNAVWTIERVYDTFPRLAERKNNGGAQLSGGEQQMLAISRALLLNPKLIIMDEPSEGLAPALVDHLIEVLRGLAREKMGLLLVEQNLRVATSVASNVAIMLGGQITATVSAAQLNADEGLQRRYLGVSTGSH
jgi:branched-chain amino acid transport system ATP-binding protein